MRKRADNDANLSKAETLKRISHVRFFNENVMKKLKTVSDTVTSTLEQRVSQIDEEGKAKIKALEAEKKSLAERGKKDTQRRLDHVRFFNESVMKRLKLKGDQYTSQLQNQMASLKTELEFKNKQSLGHATASDTEHLITTIKNEHARALAEKDRQLE